MDDEYDKEYIDGMFVSFDYEFSSPIICFLKKYIIAERCLFCWTDKHKKGLLFNCIFGYTLVFHVSIILKTILYIKREK
ncbi:hypothetical protein AB924_00120 [Listeria monocytogenes]|nr:hypothetical protein [Listeria monocytogenes]EAG7072455.1 hypothetical protein [Listeria monocytogenes]